MSDYSTGRASTLGEQLRQLGVALLLTSPLVVRFILGIASIAWAVELLMLYGVFDRVNYMVFAWVSYWLGMSRHHGEVLLAMSLLAHGFGVGYCLVRDRRAKRFIHNIVNVYGFVLWACIVVSIHVGAGGATPLAITETLLTIGAFISIAAVDLRVRPAAKVPV